MSHTPPESVTGTITAESNSLPAEVDSPTVLSWKTNAPAAEMCVSEDGAPERIVSHATHESLTVPWIKAGPTYVFRLYAAMGPRRLLDEVKVSKKAIGKITASPNIPIEPGSKEVDSPTILSWKTNVSIAEVCVSKGSAPEKLISRGTHGSLSVPWIEAGRTYAFRLYAGTAPRRLLDEVKVSKKAIGKITASPNIPTEPGLKVDSPTVLSWKTNVSVTEVCVSKDGAPEKLISHGTHESLTIPWIEAGRMYVFRLYAAMEPRQLLDEIKVSKKVTGKITASPNPIPIEAGSKTELRWQITPPARGEIRVSEDRAEEKLVCRGASGSFEISGLRPAVSYLFRLYGGAGRELLDEIEVRLTDIPWAFLLERLKRSQGKDHSARVAELIADTLPNLLRRESFGDWFRLWESKGFHVTPVHFYEPIPDSRELSEKLWEQPQNLPGVDMNEASQRRLLCEVFPTFKEEYQQIPLHPSGEENRFYLANGRFGGLDPLLAYCLMRYCKPRKIIEVGSGYSTLILAEAARANGSTELHSIEPYPQEFLTRGVAGLTSLLEKKVEEVDLSVFTDLNSGDCLFIDTSHVVRIGGDVNFLFLEVLPRLKPGVIVHVHDIFFPFEYPKDWVIEHRRFWSEQYLLQAFLAFNAEFEVLVSSGYLKARFPEELKSVFPTGDPWLGGSFWMRRKGPTQETAE